LLDKRNFSASAPALQLLLTRDRVVHVAKVFKPNKPIQLIAFRELVYLAASVLAQAPSETIRNPDVQRPAMFVGENVNPIIVVAHRVELIRDVSLRST
jgi:hypothetical protein